MDDESACLASDIQMLEERSRPAYHFGGAVPDVEVEQVLAVQSGIGVIPFHEKGVAIGLASRLRTSVCVCKRAA